jgi:hypothetical protein
MAGVWLRYHPIALGNGPKALHMGGDLHRAPIVGSRLEGITHAIQLDHMAIGPPNEALNPHQAPHRTPEATETIGLPFMGCTTQTY